MYFAKLNKEFTLGEYEKVREVISYGKERPDEFKGIQYSRVKIPNMHDVYQVIPQRFRKHFGLNLMRINSVVPAHTDSYIKMCINFYTQTENCITYFHKPIVENPKKYQIPNQSDGYMFDETDLMRDDNFIANTGEAWVLDVTKPHSVVPLGDIKERRAFTLATTAFTFDEVCDMLRETGNL
jgi:hypothetical protein